MASILRSSKFVRYIAGFARNVVLNTPREFDPSLVNNTQCLCGAIPRSFASQIQQQHDAQSLEHSLRRIDQDVRKSGRISRRDIEDVLEEIRSTKSATSSQSLLVIRCCGNLVPEELPEIRTKLVQEIWSTLNKLNIPMDISHYNALLRVYLENEHEFSPTEFLSDLETKGIEPNRVTYQRLIARYCQIGDIEGATKILEFMREKQLPVNENVFNALIVGHSQAGDMDSAQGILSVMTQAGLEPSADTYTTLLCGYAKKGDIETIEKLFQECDTKDIYLLDKDYLDIIYSLAVNGHQNLISNILSKVRKNVGYNQDAINLILRLVNKGQEDAAFLVLQSMVRITRDGNPLPSGNFLVTQLVKANRPVEKIIELCDKMEKLEINERALLIAVESCLQLKTDSKIAFPLIAELHKRGVEIRQHYFWPLIIGRDNEEILEVLKEMQKYDLIPSTETLRDYVMPNLKGTSAEIIQILRDANLSTGLAASGLVLSLIQQGNIKEAALITSTVPAFYNPDVLRRLLAACFYRTGDCESFITIVRNIYDNLDRKEVFPNKEEAIGNLILGLTGPTREFADIIEPVLRGLVEQGLSISPQAAEKIQDTLGEKLTEDLSQLLGKLTSGELTPVPTAKKAPSYTPYNQMNIPQLERLIQNLDAKGQETNGLKRQLFTLYYREKDLEKTEKLLEECKTFSYTPGICALLADLYAYHNNADKALYYLDELKKLEQNDFKIDEGKLLRIAEALVRNDRFEDALKLLNEIPRDKEREQNFAYTSQVWRFFNYLAEEKRVDDLETLFKTLVDKNFISPTNNLLGPLVKVHILNDDFDKALEKFEWCVKNYRATPWKNELATKLIQKEDAEKLQKLTDLSSEVHGEINSLYDLVFAFVECGRVRQARKILETPGLQNRPQKLNFICERYQQEGLIEPLEGLKDATKDLNHIDRSDIYYQLLLSYIKNDDAEKALGLWTQMQEEDLMPTDQFLLKLGTYLKEKDINVPFAIPQTTIPSTSIPASSTIQIEKNPAQTFRQSLRNNDVNSAIKIAKNDMNSLSTNDLSALVEKLTQNERIAEATVIVRQMVNRNISPISRVFKFYLNKLATNGDVSTLEEFARKISQDLKKVVSFDNRLCHANIMAGKAEEYLSKLDKAITEAKPEELGDIREKFPRGGAYGILERHPELQQKFEDVAIKYAEKDILAPCNVLWTHYFINNDEEKAALIWDNYLKGAPRIMFQRIVHAARENKDEALIKRLIDHLKISNVTEGAIGNAYSCLLDVLVLKEKNEEVIKVFEEAVKDSGLTHINRTAILRAKDVYDKLNQPFKYEVPAKNVKNLAISSNSSDEDRAKN